MTDRTVERIIGGVLALLLVVAGAACGTSGDKTYRFGLGTAGSGGTVYVWGGGAAKVVSQHSPQVQLTAQVAAGSGENLVRLQNGSLQIGLASNELNWELFTGEGDLPKYEHRALYAMYAGELHWGTRQSFPGNTIYDFKGKKVSFGPKGGGSYQLMKYVLDVLGLQFADFDPRYLSVSESVDALKDGVIDAYVVGLGTPASAFMDLSTMPGGVKLISLAPEDIERARAAYSFLTETVIPANTYRGVDYETRGVGRWHFMTCRADLPEEAAYEIVKALTEHHQELVAIMPAATASTPENTIRYAVIPLHQGAERYFRETGYLK